MSAYKEFKDSLNESLNTPYSIKYNYGKIKNNPAIVGSFITKTGLKYKTWAFLSDEQKSDYDWNETYEIHFSKSSNTGKNITDITNDGDALSIFSTVLEFIKHTISRMKPQTLLIKSKNNEKTRIKLYDRLIKRYASGFNYKITNTYTDINGLHTIELEKYFYK